MAKEPRDSMGVLSLNIRCNDPDVKNLSPEQQSALHEFFHIVLAAGYRLYQSVPPTKADPIIQQKFGLVIPQE